MRCSWPYVMTHPIVPTASVSEDDDRWKPRVIVRSPRKKGQDPLECANCEDKVIPGQKYFVKETESGTGILQEGWQSHIPERFHPETDPHRIDGRFRVVDSF